MGELLPAEASAIVKDERAARRAALQAVVDRNPNGKLAAKASAMIQDFEALEGGIAEVGGEDGFAFMICAAVAGGELLTDWCASHGQHRGVVWAFLAADEKRLAAYYRAKEGRADEFVDEVVGISDEQNEVMKENGGTYDPDVPRDKLRIDARLKVAGMFSPRFRSDKGVSGATPQSGIPAQITVVFVDAHEGRPAERAAIEVAP